LVAFEPFAGATTHCFRCTTRLKKEERKKNRSQEKSPDQLWPDDRNILRLDHPPYDPGSNPFNTKWQWNQANVTDNKSQATCVVCKKEFDKERSDSIYCPGGKCKQKAYRKRVAAAEAIA
jgi:hypothetical protein